METNISPKGALRDAANRLLDAACDYWRECQKLGGPRAVIWLANTDGKLVIFTRGEYREQILANILPIAEEQGFDLDDGEPAKAAKTAES